MVHWIGIEPAPPAPYSQLSNNQMILTVSNPVGPEEQNQGLDVLLVSSLLAMQPSGCHPRDTGLPMPTAQFDERVGFWIFYQQWLNRFRHLSQAEVDGIVSPVRETRARHCGDYAYAPGRPYFIALLNLEAKRHFPGRYAALLAQLDIHDDGAMYF